MNQRLVRGTCCSSAGDVNFSNFEFVVFERPTMADSGHPALTTAKF